MKFDDLERQMRVYETVDDKCILPEMYVVVRLDGRNFTRLTEEHRFEKPYSGLFQALMLETMLGVVTGSGFKFDYAYMQSDEMSLLLGYGEETFGRKVRKLISVLAGEASAHLTQRLGAVAVFDARVIQLPTWTRAADYFLWRQEDSARNCLNSYVYWILRQHHSMSGREAHSAMMGWTKQDKHDFLMGDGINFNNLPLWQKRGVGIQRERYFKLGFNPITGETTKVLRTRYEPNYSLPTGQEYVDMIACGRL